MCEFVARSVAGLMKHKKTEHILCLDSSSKSAGQRQSTRNNSVVEHLLIEDITVTGLGNRSETLLEENSLKYTCHACNYVTTNKVDIDNHVLSKHLPCDDEELRFICIICKHEFKD